MHLEQRILVTDGSGFLGSHLCDRLLTEGANVICVEPTAALGQTRGKTVPGGVSTRCNVRIRSGACWLR